MGWRARARTARARVCGPRPRGCGRTRGAARSRTRPQPPPTRRKRVRAARMRYRDSTYVLTNLHPGPRGSRRVAFATLLTTRIEISPHPEERPPSSGLPDLRGASRRMRPALLSQPFEQRRNVDLVGLVVAGERVHHDVDAGAEREFALARLG